jgi:hypothetical protein
VAITKSELVWILVFAIVVGAVMGLVGSLLRLPAYLTGAITGGFVVAAIPFLRRRRTTDQSS